MPNFRFFALGLATLFIVYLLHDLSAAATASLPTVTTHYNYYVITGNTSTELRSQMSQLGPSDRHSGQRYDANTDWNIRWSYRYNRANGQCAVRSINSQVDITFTLPRWNRPERPSRSLLDDWKQYMAALQLHENGHKQHGIEASTAILKTLKSQPTYSSCEELKTKVDAAVQKVVSYYNREDINYDEITQHGSTQGAIFPLVSTAER